MKPIRFYLIQKKNHNTTNLELVILVVKVDMVALMHQTLVVFLIYLVIFLGIYLVEVMGEDRRTDLNEDRILNII